MQDSEVQDPEEVGGAFSILGMLDTRAKTRAVITEGKVRRAIAVKASIWQVQSVWRYRSA